MVEIFKTDIKEVKEADKVCQILMNHFPENEINFDLEDCDNILRVEGLNSVSIDVIRVLNNYGYSCEELF